MMKILSVLLFVYFTAGPGYASQLINVNDSTGIIGCWMSQQSKSEESVLDSIYNTNYYYVQFNMCLDEYFNIEINKKVKFDCCNEDNFNYEGTYTLENDTLLIYIDGSRSVESYKYNIVSQTLHLIPLNSKIIDADKPLLKFRWTRY